MLACFIDLFIHKNQKNLLTAKQRDLRSHHSDPRRGHCIQRCTATRFRSSSNGEIREEGRGISYPLPPQPSNPALGRKGTLPGEHPLRMAKESGKRASTKGLQSRAILLQELILSFHSVQKNCNWGGGGGVNRSLSSLLHPKGSQDSDHFTNPTHPQDWARLKPRTRCSRSRQSPPGVDGSRGQSRRRKSKGGNLWPGTGPAPPRPAGA